MNFSELLDIAKKEVGNGETKEAINLLIENIESKDGKIYNELILFNSRLKTTTKKSNLGLIRNDDLAFEVNKINYSFLSLIDYLKDKDSNQYEFEFEKKSEAKLQGISSIGNVSSKLIWDYFTNLIQTFSSPKNFPLTKFAEYEENKREKVLESFIFVISSILLVSIINTIRNNISSSDAFSEVFWFLAKYSGF